MKKGRDKNKISFQMQFKSVEVKEDDVVEIEGWASTSEIDRYDDIVQPTAFKGAMEEYMDNPVVLLQHDMEKGIGTIVDYDIRDKGLWVKAEITQNTDNVKKKIKDEVMRGFSIGFVAKKWEFKEKDDGEGQLRIIKDLELLEISVVNVPANKGSLFTVNKALKEFFDKEQKIMQSARTPEYEETETTSWGDVSKDMEDFVDGYYTQNPDAEPESQEEIPETVDDMPAAMKNWIAQKTLLGDPEANNFENLAFFPVVNPSTNNLNKGALIAVRSGRGQEADISNEAYQSADQKAKELLADEFDVEYDDEDERSVNENDDKEDKNKNISGQDVGDDEDENSSTDMEYDQEDGSPKQQYKSLLSMYGLDEDGKEEKKSIEKFKLDVDFSDSFEPEKEVEKYDEKSENFLAKTEEGYKLPVVKMADGKKKLSAKAVAKAVKDLDNQPEEVQEKVKKLANYVIEKKEEKEQKEKNIIKKEKKEIKKEKDKLENKLRKIKDKKGRAYITGKPKGNEEEKKEEDSEEVVYQKIAQNI